MDDYGDRPVEVDASAELGAFERTLAALIGLGRTDAALPPDK